MLGYLCAIPLPRWLGVPALWGAAGLTASAGVAGWIEMLLLRRRAQSTHRSHRAAARLRREALGVGGRCRWRGMERENRGVRVAAPGDSSPRSCLAPYLAVYLGTAVAIANPAPELAVWDSNASGPRRVRGPVSQARPSVSQCRSDRRPDASGRRFRPDYDSSRLFSIA